MKKVSKDKKRLLLFVYLGMLISLWMFVAVPDVRAGLVFLVISIVNYVLLVNGDRDGRRVTEVYITKDYGNGIAYGLVFALLFIIATVAIPGFSILIPTLPGSISTILNIAVIIILAPILETILFPKILQEKLQATTGMSKQKANFWKSFVFVLFHFLSYGILLGALGTLTDLYGAVVAVSGSLIGAFAFSMLDGWIAYKFKNLLINIITHAGINAYILYKIIPFAIVS
ncbi:MAG: CPBP family intramembrane metalloprotease [Nanoarchaeota archaeon]|nr:CPBP family intramembrane metalloprotease [Nanoarchaeota archaeon]